MLAARSAVEGAAGTFTTFDRYVDMNEYGVTGTARIRS